MSLTKSQEICLGKLISTPEYTAFRELAEASCKKYKKQIDDYVNAFISKGELKNEEAVLLNNARQRYNAVKDLIESPIEYFKNIEFNEKLEENTEKIL